MSRHSPPRIACLLLESLVALSYREAIIGDLVEDYAVRCNVGSRLDARWWFWSQACRSLLPLAWSSLRDRWLSNVVSALAAYIVIAALKISAGLAIVKVFTPGPNTDVVLAPILFLSAAAVGGCIAARVRRGVVVCLALFVLVTVAILIPLKLCAIPVAWWYPFAFLTLGPLTVVLTPVLVRALALSLHEAG